MDDADDDPFLGLGYEPGLFVWRMDGLRPRPLSEQGHGTFRNGSCYIVVECRETPRNMGIRVYSWIGVEASVEAKASAALQADHLARSLGGTLQREVQYNETEGFSQLWTPMLQYDDSCGEEDGLKSRRKEHAARLFRFKESSQGYLSMLQVPLGCSSLNAQDVFVLDSEHSVFQLNGTASSAHKRGRAMEVATKIVDTEHRGRVRVQVIEQATEEIPTEFWEILGGSGPIAEYGVQSTTLEYEPADLLREALRHPELYHLSDASGSMSLRMLNEHDPVLHRNMLDSADSYVLNCGDAMFVWLGENCTFQERQMAVQVAKGLFERDGHPSWMKLTRVLEGSEPPEFCKLFQHWDPPAPPDSREPIPAKVDFEALHAAGGAQAIVDTTGEVRVWRVVSARELEEVSADQLGSFFTNDIYFVAHTSTSLTLYYWQGAGSGKAGMFMYGDALGTVMKQLKPSLKPLEVRLVEGSEPIAFIALFAGRFICRRGGKGKHVTRRKKKGAQKPAVELFHVRGSSELDTRAAQVEPQSSSVNSGDSFILVQLESAPHYVWFGNSSNNLEHETAIALGTCLAAGAELVHLHEGEDDDTFWELLGGQRDPSVVPQGSPEAAEARLFTVVYCSGAFLVDEVPGFTQADLVHDQVAVLDVHHTVYMWIGSGAMDVTSAEGHRFTEKYIKTAPGRNPEAVIVQHGSEPADFTQQFLAWKPMTVFEDPYKKRKRLQEEKLKKQAQEASASVMSAAACTVSGPGLQKSADEVAGWLGIPYTCVVQAMTGDGDKCVTGGDIFVAELRSDEMFRALKASVVDQGDGTYTVSFLPPIWGQCELHIWCQQQDMVSGTKQVALKQSPLMLWIEEGATATADSCTLSGSGISECTAGAQAHFKIDVAGALIQNGASVAWNSKLVLVKATAVLQLPCSTEQDLAVSIEHVPESNSYLATYTALVEGTYNLEVRTAGGEQLEGSPFTVRCVDRGCATRASVAVGRGLMSLIVGQPATLELHLLSDHGNPKPLSHQGALDISVIDADDAEVELSISPQSKTWFRETNVTEHVQKFSYTPKIAGVHTVSISLEGAHVAGSPFKPVATQAQHLTNPQQPNASASAPELGRVLLDERCELQLSLKDHVGELCHLADIPQFSCTWTNCRLPAPRCVDVFLGQRSCVVLKFDQMPFEASSDQPIALAISLDNHPLFGSPYQVTTANSLHPISPSYTIFDGPRACPCGAEYTWTIHGCDSNGVSTQSTKEIVAANFELVDGCSRAKVPARVQFQGHDGSAIWKVTCKFLHAGRYRAQLTLRGAHICGSPFTVEVEPGAPDSRLCWAVGRGATYGQIGQENSFEVYLRDSCGNAIVNPAAPQDLLRVELMGPEMLQADMIQWSEARGCFLVNYTVYEEGIYTLSVLLAGCHVSSSPFTCEVVAPEDEQNIPASQCHAEWEQKPSSCGESAKLMIRAPQPGVDVQMQIQDHHGSAACLVLDKGDGRYVGLFKPLSPGEYMVSVKVAGEHVPGSPFSEFVHPGPCSARHCVAVLDDPQSVTDVPKEFKVPMTLHLRDAFGNAVCTPAVHRSVSSRSVSVSLQTEGGSEALETCGEDSGNGEVEFWFGKSAWFKASPQGAPSQAGTSHKVVIKYNNTPVCGSEFQLSTAGEKPSVYSLRLKQTKVQIPQGTQQSFILEGASAMELSQLSVSFTHGACTLRRHLQGTQSITEVLCCALRSGESTLIVQGAEGAIVEVKGSPCKMEVLEIAEQAVAMQLVEGSFVVQGKHYKRLAQSPWATAL